MTARKQHKQTQVFVGDIRLTYDTAYT